MGRFKAGLFCLLLIAGAVLLSSCSDDELINVLDYGVAGDGVTDDTAAIFALADSVQASGGGCLYFPEGSYLISTSALREYRGLDTPEGQ